MNGHIKVDAETVMVLPPKYSFSKGSIVQVNDAGWESSFLEVLKVHPEWGPDREPAVEGAWLRPVPEELKGQSVVELTTGHEIPLDDRVLLQSDWVQMDDEGRKVGVVPISAILCDKTEEFQQG